MRACLANPPSLVYLVGDEQTVLQTQSRKSSPDCWCTNSWLALTLVEPLECNALLTACRIMPYFNTGAIGTQKWARHRLFWDALSAQTWDVANCDAKRGWLSLWHLGGSTYGKEQGAAGARPGSMCTDRGLVLLWWYLFFFFSPLSILDHRQ